MIIATAGHVDHGKTSLVRVLTGVDTDRLEEEKRRGMTIDIGFAYADYGGAMPIALVDVPGHERFLRNMLAGVSRVDLGLLVVAADDGPMPQTREHLSILGLTGAEQLVVALTKIDRVDAARLAEARDAIELLLAASPWPDAPIFALSSQTGEGVEPLRSHLRERAAAPETPPAGAHFRMAIDRAFSVAGAGLVVTGTVLAGCARVGDELRVAPLGASARVRAIHAHQQAADRAQAGQRCALNLAGSQLHAEAIGRGQWLLAPEVDRPSERIDVLLQWLPQALEGRNPARLPILQLHHGTATVNARLALLASHDAATSESATREGATGEGTLAQLVLDRPISALHGDRFVLRDPTAQRTLAGGTVLDPFAPARGRARPWRLGLLRAMVEPDAEGAWQALLAASPAGVPLATFLLSRNLVTLGAPMRRLRTSEGELGVAPAWWSRWQETLLGVLGRAHQEHPDQVGLTEPELQRAAMAQLAQQLADPEPLSTQRTQAARVVKGVIDDLLAASQLRRDGLCLRLPDHQPRLGPEDEALLTRVLPMLQAAGLRPPIVGEIAHTLGLERADLLVSLRRIANLGHLVAVAPNRFFPPATVETLAGIARQLAADSADGRFDAAAYRDASGIGRNLTIEVLEFLDRLGVTRFAGERRSILN